MSKFTRIALVGATGLVGQHVLRLAVGRDDLRVVALARREVPLPPGARMEVFVAEPDKWGEVLHAVRPDALISALGTTIAKVGGDREAFRAVDHRLVVDTAKMARSADIERLIAVSSVGANPHTRNFYLSVKGQAETELMKAGFSRLDILRPGLLKGARQHDQRTAERLAMLASPVTDLFLQGDFAKYRSIRAETVARAAIALALRKTRGKYLHDNAAIHRVAASLALPQTDD